MAFTQVPVTGAYLTAGGDPATGSVTFGLSDQVRNGSVLAPTRVTVTLVAGAIPDGTTLCALDDPGTAPANAHYSVVEHVGGVSVSWDLLVSADDDEIDLGTVARATTTPVGAAVYQPVDEKGEPGGYAPLDEDGLVPAENLPAGSGGEGGATDHGALTGLADDDHTQYLTTARGDARYYTETEVDTALAAKATTAALAAHEADTTSIHGIADTSALETTTGSAAKVTTHAGATDPHGDRAFATSAVSTHAGATDPHADRAYTDTQIATRQALDSDLTAIAGLSPSNDDVVQRKAGAWTNRTMAQVKTDLSLTKSDVGLSNVTNNAQVTGVTAGDATITVGGTATAPTVAVTGSTFQPLDSDLTTIAGLTATTDNFIQSKSSAWASRTPTQVAADLVTPLSSSLQPLDSELTALASTTSAANKVPYFTGSGTAAVADFTSAARSLVDDSSVGAMRSTLSVQASPPASQGVAAWAFDPAAAPSSSLLTNGSVYLVRISNPPDGNITKIYWGVATAGATATAGQNWAGLYDSAGTVLGSVGVDSDAGSGTGLKTSTIASTAVVSTAFYWVAFLFNCSTAPTVSRSFTGTAGAAISNVGLTASTARFGIAATGQTTLPTITPASITATGTTVIGLWAAIGT